MRRYLLLAALMLSAESPPPSTVQFEQNLNTSNLTVAAASIDKLIESRTPADGKPRPDPLLNSMLGQLYLASDDPAAAKIYLDHAPIASLSPGTRATTAIAHGRAAELRGDRALALTAFREAAGASLNDADRRTAALGIARQLLPDDPAAARAQVATMANGPALPDRWRARAIDALAASLLGDGRGAAALADLAWTDAGNAPIKDLAPIYVATIRAGLAASRHDLIGERTMLMATNGLALSASAALGNQLPVCGDDGLTPADFVIFGFVAGPYSNHLLFPIAASRPAAVAPFQRALDEITPVKDANGHAPVGTVFTVSCRPVIDASYIAKPLIDDPLLIWFVDQGIYPVSASNEADDSHTNAIGERIDALSARFGKDSPLLIGPRWQMLTLLERRKAAGDAVLPGQLTDLAAQISEGLKRAAAPQLLVDMIDWRGKIRQLRAEVATDPDKIVEAQSQIQTELQQAPFNLSRLYLNNVLSQLEDDWPAPIAKLVVDLNPKATALAGRERQAWLLNVAYAQYELGQDKDARLSLAAGNFEKDLCLMTDSAPKLLEQHFSYGDYPDDLIAGDQEGSEAYAFSLTPAGRISSPRVLFSLPSGIFDEVTARGLPAVRYEPPTRSGKPVSCRGIVQTIQWRLADENDFAVPTLTPESIGPIS